MEKQNETEGKLSELPACAAEFIKLVINKMRYRKKIRQDVQAELAVHFEDELKECTTDGDKEQKAQQLIAEFGDVKLLAVLLRRAKKRCRPLWRTAVVRTLQTVVVLIVCFVIYIVWFLTGKPVITTDYVAELNRIVRPIADETQNAAPLYHKAAELYEKVPEDVSKLLGNKYREAVAEEKQLVEKWLNENKETLELVISGAQKPYYWRMYGNKRYPDVMMAILMPSLADFRNLARVLLWRAHLHAEQGRYEDAFGDIKCCYRFGQHLRGDKSLIEQLVGMAIEAFAAQTLRDILSEHRIDSPVLAELQQGFEKMIADEDCTVSFKFEKLSIYDEIQRCFTEDRFGGGHLYLSRISALGDVTSDDLQEIVVETIFSPGQWPRAARVLFFHPDKQQTREMADRCYAFWGKIAQKTPAQIRAEGIDTEKEAMEIIKGNLLLEIFTPAIGRVCEIAHRGKADIEAALTIIAILRYEQDSGGYPQNLEQLVADDYLKKLSIDPYSDEPLVYRRTDDGFTLYSAGPNFIDDGGTIFYDDRSRPRWRGTTKGGDTVFWPVPKSQLKQ